jgi:hypothetical protein
MTGSRLGLSLVVIFVASSACRTSKPIDAMMMAPVCDSTPATPAPNEGGPHLPKFEPQSTSHASVLGTVEEAVSRRPLHGAPVDLFIADSVNGSHAQRRVYTDQLGGFVFDSISPGQYTVKARFFSHQPIQREVMLRAGRPDTVRFSMRRYVCTGY